MARPDLTNEQIEKMGREKPGSAEEYMRLRREELAAERRARLEKADYERYERVFVENGGTKAGAKASHDRRREEEAERAARRADEAAVALQARRMRELLWHETREVAVSWLARDPRG